MRERGRVRKTGSETETDRKGDILRKKQTETKTQVDRQTDRQTDRQ